MAFTPDEESALKLIISAFENGKRLSDLPLATGTNPYDMLVEVLDEDGESKKAALATLLPYAEEQCSYGIEFDTTISTPTCTRVGSSDLHKRCPIQSRLRGCLLDDDGKVVEYLDPSDWTGHDRSGARGQVMVEIPTHYRKFETEGNKRRVLLSEFPLPGYEQVPLCYVSAYEATVDRAATKLCSVVNINTNYRGGNNNGEWDGTYRSLLGRPATGISRTTFRTYARKRKTGSTEWNCMTYDIQKTLYWLFVVEYATLNSQAAFNASPTSDGYRQGGLGSGVTTWDSGTWNTFNSYYPFVPCGVSDSLGNYSGVVTYHVANADNSISKDFEVPRYHGIENPFGHIWQWTDGINVRISATKAKGGDELSKVFVCHDPAKFNNSNYTGYSHVGNEARNEGYVKEVIFGVGGEIMPKLCTGGGSTTYFCDYHYTNIPNSGEVLRGVLFGGDANHGAAAGFAYALSSYAPSTTSAHIGSRLCFIPRSDA